MDRLAGWLKTTDSLGGSLDLETDRLLAEWRKAESELNAAITAATGTQVAEDDIAFTEAIAPVEAAVARLKDSLNGWQAFLKEIRPGT